MYREIETTAPWEKWRVIPGFDRYEVSDWGRVRNPHGWILDGDMSFGYVRYDIRPASGDKKKALRGNALVLTTWVSPRPSALHDAAHNNGIRSDNRLSNLRWATKKENSMDRWTHGTMLFGESNPAAVLNADQVREIRARYAGGGVTQLALAREFGVSKPLVQRIVTRKIWLHVE